MDQVYFDDTKENNQVNEAADNCLKVGLTPFRKNFFHLLQ